MGDTFWRDKVVIVTGASSGVGWETALLLAERGAKITLAARNTTALEELAHLIHSRDGKALVVTTDVTQSAQVNDMVQQSLEHWGDLDVLIANAGQYIRAPIIQMSPTDLERSLRVNFWGSVYCVLSVLPHFMNKGSGYIGIVSTMDAKKGLPLDAPYVAAKFAVTGFGEVLRQELYLKGIHVTMVFPGRIDTPMIAHIKVPWISAKIPADKVAEAILSGIERRKAEVYVPVQTHLLRWVNFLSPRFADQLVRLFHLEGWE